MATPAFRNSASLLASLLAAAPAASRAGGSDVPPAPFTLEPAAALHVSAEGLRALGDAIEGVLPEQIAATGLSGVFDCDEEEEGELVYSAEDIVLHLSADDVEIVASDGRLDVGIEMTLWSDPSALTVVGPCVVELDEACTLGLPPTWLHADLGVLLALQEGQLSAAVDELSFTHGNFGNPVETGCLLGDALETLNGWGVDLLGQLLDQALSDQIAELETQLDEQLASLTTALAIEQSLEAMGATLDVKLEATQLEASETGLLIGFSGSFGTPAYGACVPHAGPYLASAHDMPALSGFIPQTDVPYHMAVVASEDLFNQALYAAWQGGMLCLRLGDLVDIAITTDYLALVEEELVAELWPEPQALDIYVLAEEPPRVKLEGGPVLDAALRLDVYGNELDRVTRFWGNGLFADAGFDLLLEEGQLAVDLGFDLETQLGVTVSYNEWLPQAIPEGFASLVPDLASQALDLESLVPSFAVPSFYGLTVSDLEMRVVGETQDWLGVFAWIDPEAAEPMEIGPIELSGIGCGDSEGGGEITIPGCEDGGCGGESSGCSSEDGGCSTCSGDESGSCSGGGCSVKGVPLPGARAWLGLGVAGMLLGRRRRAS